MLALDPDAAGQEATLRSLESSWRVFERQKVVESRRSVGSLYQARRLDLKIAALPAGQDPDALIREAPKEWERLIDEAVPFPDFAIPAMASKYDLTSDAGKAQAAETLLPLVTATSNAFEQERLFRMLAKALDVSEAALEASVGRPRPTAPTRRAAERSPGPALSPLTGRPKGRPRGVHPQVARGADRVEAARREPQPRPLSQNGEPGGITCLRDSTTIEELRDRLDDSLNEHLDHLAQTGPDAYRTAIRRSCPEQSMRRLEQRHLQEIQESLLASDDESLPPPRDLEDRSSASIPD